MNSFFLFLIVAFIFYILTKNNNEKTYKNKYQGRSSKFGKFEEVREGREVTLIVAMMAKLAKADGRICELEARLISGTLTHLSNYFYDSDFARSKLKQVFNYEKNRKTSIYDIAKRYFYVVNGDYNKCLNLIEFLLNLSLIDGEYSQEERIIVEEIARSFRIKDSDYERILNNFYSYYANREKNYGVNSQNAYEILGLNNNADFSEVKKKYRQLVREYHPDILMGQGKSNGVIEDATKKLQEINSAYEEIKKSQIRD